MQLHVFHYSELFYCSIVCSDVMVVDGVVTVLTQSFSSLVSLAILRAVTATNLGSKHLIMYN